jgi:hypothetical protein
VNHGIVKLSEILPVGLLADLKQPKPKDDDRVRPVKPPRVIGDPTRTPADYQAAKMLFKSSWIYQPLPPALEIKPELERLREENAVLKGTNAQIIKENSTLRNRVERLTKLVSAKQPNPAPTSLPAKPSANDPRQSLLERLKNG